MHTIAYIKTEFHNLDFSHDIVTSAHILHSGLYHVDQSFIHLFCQPLRPSVVPDQFLPCCLPLLF